MAKAEDDKRAEAINNAGARAGPRPGLVPRLRPAGRWWNPTRAKWLRLRNMISAEVRDETLAKTNDVEAAHATEDVGTKTEQATGCGFFFFLRKKISARGTGSKKCNVNEVIFIDFASTTFNSIVEWTSEIEVQPTLGESTTASKLTLAEAPQVDHRIGQNFEGVMQLTYALKPKQKAAELILPTEHPLNRIEPLFEYGSVEERLAASLGDFSTTRIGVNVGYHAAIENGFAVLPAIIAAIQADDGSLEVKANRMGDACHLRQGFAQQRQFIAIPGCCNKWCDHIAIAVAESDDLIAFHFLMAAEPNIDTGGESAITQAALRKASKWEHRVFALGVLVHDASIRIKLIATAVATCCRRVFAIPI